MQKRYIYTGSQPPQIESVPFPGLVRVKGDLDGTIFSYDWRMRFLERALLASSKNRTQLSPLNIAFTYDCRRILKHVLKSYDIFRVVCVCRKDVVG